MSVTRSRQQVYPYLFANLVPLTPSCLLRMFYKQGSFAGRIVPTEAGAAYQPQGLGGLREVQGPVIEVPMSSSATGTSPNTVRYWQETYKKSKAPVYLLKGSRDVFIYRGLMGTALVGLAYMGYTYYLMATGKMKKKETA